MAAYTEVIVWGSDALGQLGLGKKEHGKTYSRPIFCSYHITIQQVACGEEHAAFIAQNGRVYSMGSNIEGRLGVGNAGLDQCPSPCLVEGLVSKIAVTLSCGGGHTAVVCDDGSLYTWGAGEFGALGLGTTETQWEPVQVTLPIKAKSVSCGWRHTAILVGQTASDRALLTCGAGDDGQLGTGRRDRELTPVQVHLAELIRQAACGVYHTLLLTDSGRVLSTGGNNCGQLGIGSKLTSYSPVRVRALEDCFIEKVAAGSHSAALSDRGEIYIWGSEAFGESLLPQKLNKLPASFKDIALGTAFGLAVDRLNQVWTWGSNASGELGIATYRDASEPVQVGDLDGKTIRKVECGGGFVIALGSDVTEQAGEGSYREVSGRLYGEARDQQPSRATSSSRGTAPLLTRPDRSPQRRPLNDSSYVRYLSPYARTTESRLPNTADRDERLGRSFRVPDLKPTLYSGHESPQVRHLDDAAERLRSRQEPSRLRLHRVEDESRRNLTDTFAEARKGPELALLERRIGDLERQLLSSNAELTVHREKHELLSRENDRLTTELQVQRRENDDMRQRAKLELQSRVDELKRSSSHSASILANQIDELSTELDREKAQRKLLDSQIADLQRINDRVQKENMALHRKSAETETSLKGTTAKLTTLDQDNAQLARELSHANDNLRRQAALMDDKEKKHQAELTSKVDDLRRQHYNLKDLANAKIAELENALASQFSVQEAIDMKLTDKEQQVHQLNVELEAETHKARRTGQELQDLSNKLDRALEEHRASRRSAEADIAKKDALITQLELELKDKALRVRQLEGIEDELDARVRELDQELTHSSNLQRDVEHLHSENDRLRTQADEARKQAEYKLTMTIESASKQQGTMVAQHRAQVSDLEGKLNQTKADLAKKGRDLEQETTVRRDVEARLTEEKLRGDNAATELSRAHRKLEEQATEIDSLRSDNDYLAQTLRTAELERSQLMNDQEIISRHLKDLENDLAQKSHALQTTDSAVSELRRDNERLRRGNEEARFEVDRLSQQVNDHLNTVERLHSVLDEWEVKYHHLADENYRLQSELTESEAKNKALFESLEKTLALRAKEYRDRTLSMLSTPYKSGDDDPSSYVTSTHPQPSPAKTIFSRASPARRQAEPARRTDDRSPLSQGRSELSRDSRAKIGNTAARLLEGMSDDSPLNRYQVTSPIRTQSLRNAASPVISGTYSRDSRSPNLTAKFPTSQQSSKETPQSALGDFRTRLASFQDEDIGA